MDREWTNKLLSRVDVVKVIARYIPLKKQGNNHWGNCPFHHEKTPSFCVSENKQFYHCFGCKESGNAIGFVSKIENIGFVDAVKILCKDAGMELPQDSFGYTKDKDTAKSDKLYAVLRDAAIYYHHNLSKAEGATTVQYLDGRGISKELATKFGLGYSIDSKGVIDYLQSRGHTIEEMTGAGIVNNINGDNYDVFNNRLIIPIVNHLDNVVGFGGRDMTGQSKAKYRNSAQGDIFDKSSILFGLNLLKKYKRAGGKIPYVLLVEGYMDLIALHKAGFENVVASMGTALTKYQAKLIKNYSDNVVISYDGDFAGQKATLRSLDILESCGLSVRVVAIDDNLDPDEYLDKYGADSYSSLVAKSQTLVEYKLRNVFAGYDNSDTAQRIKCTDEALQIIVPLDALSQTEYLPLVAMLSGYSVDILNKRMTEKSDAQDDTVNILSTGDTQVIKSEDPLEFVLASMVEYQEWVDDSIDLSKYDIVSRDIVSDIYCHYKDNKDKDIDSRQPFAYLYDNDLQDSDKQLLDSIMNWSFVQGDGVDKYMDCLRSLKKKYLENYKATALQNGDYQSVMDIDRQLRNIRNDEF